ncbi:MAG: SnoaL-like domain-containing protein, partial [Phycisphaerae bacterium]|nr:SnoaL-like domain-containing protein [Phycisphaerae bacterium]
KVVAENMQVVAGPCMGYTVTEEVGENMTADGKPVEVRFRATNIFRKEQGGWKMVHHHTDLSAGLIGATGEVK